VRIRTLCTLAAAAIAVFGSTTGVLAEEVSIAAFFGEYEGQSITSTDEGLSVRDLSVVIKERKDGFNLEWTTITVNVDGMNKRKSYDIDFRSTPRDDIYASEMRRDKFGGQVPLNPLKGDPYVWARQEGGTLTVYAMVITEDGSYEMQQYDRKLTEDGLDLAFSRIRDGEQLKVIKGTLKRVGD
jgi:hypothetical protein